MTPSLPGQRGSGTRRTKRLRSTSRLFYPDELLPDVTNRIGKPMRFWSAAHRRAFEKLWAKLAEQQMRRAA